MRACVAFAAFGVVLGAGILVGQTNVEKAAAADAPLTLLSVTRSNTPAGTVEPPLLLADAQPLLLLDDEPLLLDDEPLLLDNEPVTNAPAEPGADNSRCRVCHLNFMQEAITVVHARTNIGCASCHGPSDAHIADESWASGGNGTAPDRIYRKSLSRFACLGCHNWVKLVESDQKKTELKDRPDHLAVLDGTNREKRFCTDCHGQHRMVNRKCKWK